MQKFVVVAKAAVSRRGEPCTTASKGGKQLLLENKKQTKNNNKAKGKASSKVWGVSSLGKIVNKYSGWGLKKKQ